MKNYLRAYVNHLQDNWVDHLQMAEFLANNYINKSTGMTLFFADNSFHPCRGVEPPQAYQQGASQKAKLLTADRIVNKRRKHARFCKSSSYSHSKNRLTGPMKVVSHIQNIESEI